VKQSLPDALASSPSVETPSVPVGCHRGHLTGHQPMRMEEWNGHCPTEMVPLYCVADRKSSYVTDHKTGCQPIGKKELNDHSETEKGFNSNVGKKPY